MHKNCIFFCYFEKYNYICISINIKTRRPRGKTVIIMKKIRIIAICDPYHARSHYNGQEIIRMDGATPVCWVIQECSTIEEAREILWQFAREIAINSANLSHKDNEDIEYVKSLLIEEEGLTETEVNEMLSWFRGEGIYYTSTNKAMMLKGDNSYSFDVMTYCIEEY